MMHFERLSTLASRLDSVDSGISDELDSPPVSSWSPTYSPTSTESSPVLIYNTRDEAEAAVERVKDTAVELAHDIVCCMTETTIKSSSRYSKTLCRLAKELSLKHEILFTSLVKKLDLTQNDLDCQFLENIADRMFSDEQYNWGRIVTLFAFAGWLARYCVQHHLHSLWPQKIAEETGNYVAEKLGFWISRQGGWDAMEEFFKEPEDFESKIWRGLLYTVLGLGALATTVAVVR